MKSKKAITMLSALAQESRLAIFRMLVRFGSEGVPAGLIARRLKLPAPTCSFHLKEMLNAGLVHRERQGRSLLYTVDISATSALLGYLTKNCCVEETKDSLDSVSTRSLESV